MIIRVSMEEVLQMLGKNLQAQGYRLQSIAAFKKDYGSYNGGVGDAYDIPDFVEFEAEFAASVSAV